MYSKAHILYLENEKGGKKYQERRHANIKDKLVRVRGDQAVGGDGSTNNWASLSIMTTRRRARMPDPGAQHG